MGNECIDRIKKYLDLHMCGVGGGKGKTPTKFWKKYHYFEFEKHFSLAQLSTVLGPWAWALF